MEPKPDESEGAERPDPAGEADPRRPKSLRDAVSETLAATSGSASHGRERAAGMIDELVRRGRAEIERGRQEAGELAKRGQEATGDLAKRGQAATGGLAKRGQEATGELAKRGQEATEGLARRGQEATGGIARVGNEARDELARRFEAFEARLASIEELLRSAPPDRGTSGQPSSPEASEPAPRAENRPASEPQDEG